MSEAETPIPPVFDAEFQARLRELFVWRRDVRRFRADPIPDETLTRLLETACLAPSVGLSQPWRFVVVEDIARRRAILDIFDACNRDALADYSEDRAGLYARLKLAGMREAPRQLAVFADGDTQTGHGLGRRTMPEMLDYSVVAAICNLWLAARAEGIGVGWVSILDPQRVADALDVPASWRLISYLCLGYPEAEDVTPELEIEGWESRRAIEAGLLRR